MSLYNIVHGTNPIAKDLMTILELTKVGRFLDIHLLDDRIRLLTKNGGPNKEYGMGNEGIMYGLTSKKPQHVCLPTRRCMVCLGCIMKDILPKHPNFIREYDSMHDNVYAYVEFSLPERISDGIWEKLRKRQPDTMNLKEKMEHFKANPDHPKYAKAQEHFKKVFADIEKDKSDPKNGIKIIRI